MLQVTRTDVGGIVRCGVDQEKVEPAPACRKWFAQKPQRQKLGIMRGFRGCRGPTGETSEAISCRQLAVLPELSVLQSFCGCPVQRQRLPLFPSARPAAHSIFSLSDDAHRHTRRRNCHNLLVFTSLAAIL